MFQGAVPQEKTAFAHKGLDTAADVCIITVYAKSSDEKSKREEPLQRAFGWCEKAGRCVPNMAFELRRRSLLACDGRTRYRAAL